MGMLYWKHRIINTPLEGPASALRDAMGWLKRRRHPELGELYREEACLAAVMTKLIGERSNCIDIGCHIGATLARMVRLAPGGRHWAFEPIAEKVQWLSRKFPNVRVKQIAVSDQPGELVLHENLTRPGFTGVGERQDQGGPEQVWRTVCVPASPLDEIVPGHEQIDFIKIDVEGSEIRVFEGARKLLARCRPVVIFESSRGNARRAGITPGDLYDKVRSCGFHIYLLGEYLDGGGPISRTTFEEAQTYPFRAFNYLALPNR